MKVVDVMKRIQDIDLAIVKINDGSQNLSDNDRKHIVMFLEDYKGCLKSRKIAGDFAESNCPLAEDRGK